MRLQLNILISELKGRLGGTVFQGSAYGPIAHTFARPPLETTGEQFKARAAMYQVAKAWQELTPQERNSWNDAAQMEGTGYSLFQSRNLRLELAGQPLATTYSPPGPLAIALISDELFHSNQPISDLYMEVGFIYPSGTDLSNAVVDLKFALSNSQSIEPKDSQLAKPEGLSETVVNNIIVINFWTPYTSSRPQWRQGNYLKFTVQLFDKSTGNPITVKTTSGNVLIHI